MTPVFYKLRQITALSRQRSTLPMAYSRIVGQVTVKAYAVRLAK